MKKIKPKSSSAFAGRVRLFFVEKQCKRKLTFKGFQNFIENETHFIIIEFSPIGLKALKILKYFIG